MVKKYVLKKFGLISALSLFSFLFISCDGDGSSDGSSPNETEEISNETEEIGNPGESSPPLQTSQINEFDNISVEDREAALTTLIIESALQKRSEMQLNGTLASVARARAEDMANSGYFSHTNLDGNGPNFLVRDAGYILPDSYGMELDSNNIESIAAGYENAGDTLEAWINSPGHRTHVFGEIPFHREQVDFGVGFAANPESPYGFYWVFISARQKNQ